MPCPNCDHTLGRLCIHEGMSFDMCERCGTTVVTILDANPSAGNPRVYTPKLVERCRRFEEVCNTKGAECLHPFWHRLGIDESIHTPERRPNQ